MRNPEWTRDELILALDLYFQSNQLRIRKDDERIIELSCVLNRLQTHITESDTHIFRSPASVYLHLAHFFSVDPGSSTDGFANNSRAIRALWDEFADDKDRLHQLADGIKRRVNTTDRQPVVDVSAPIDESYEAPEGRIIYYEHRARERNPSLVERKKKLVLRQSGDLQCEVCGFSFKQRYGDIGNGFIECHHRTPVSQMNPGDKTRLEDLSLVCANCHRMLHAKGERLTVDALRTIVVTSSPQGS